MPRSSRILRMESSMRLLGQEAPAVMPMVTGWAGLRSWE